MSDQSEPSRLQVLFEASMQDYEKQTGIVLAKHPLAAQLQNCDSVESVTAVLREQTQAFSEFRGKDKILKLLKNTVSFLHKLSAAADRGHSISLVRLWALIRLSDVSDPHPIAFPACESNTNSSCYLALCMRLTLVPKRILS